LDHYDGYVIDSKYILAVKVIQRAVKQWKEKRNKKKMSSNDLKSIVLDQSSSKKKALRIMPEYV
jgi:hypothetical protein